MIRSYWRRALAGRFIVAGNQSEIWMWEGVAILNIHMHM